MKKALLLVFPSLISAAAFGQQQQGGLQGAQVQPNAGPAQGGQGRPNFEQRKQLMLDRIDQRINALQSAKNCMSQAQTPQALKACRPQRPEGGQPRQ